MRQLVCLLLMGMLLCPTAKAADLPVVSEKDWQSLLSEAQGTPLIVVFWASWCVPCRHFRQKIEALRKEYPEKTVHILGVSLDTDQARVTAYLNTRPLAYPTVLGDTNFINTRMGKPVPTTQLYTRSGQLQKELIGDVSEKRLRHYVRKILLP